jgi:translation initiation factor IF-2
MLMLNARGTALTVRGAPPNFGLTSSGSRGGALANLLCRVVHIGELLAQRTTERAAEQPDFCFVMS